MKSEAWARGLVFSGLILCGLSAASLTACQKPQKQAPKPSLTVTVEAVGVRDLAQVVTASGSVGAWRDVPVGAEAGGLTAVEVNVDEGSRVQAGQLLVKLDDRLLQAQVRQQQAAVASARAVLAKNEAAFARSQALAKLGYLAKANLEISQADQQTAEAQLQTAQAALAETQAKQDQTNIRAPVSGLVSSRTVVKGQIVSIGTELLRIVRDDQLELAAQIPEADLPRVKAGASAKVSDEQGRATTGRVRLITPQVDTQTRLALARISLPAGSGFSSGEFARAEIDAGRQSVVAVPQDAIVFHDGKPDVFVVDASNHAHQRSVRTGDHVQGYVAILSGLQAGERVATSGVGFLGEGDLVRIRAAAPAPAASTPGS
jgi:RND family efflux transporter MFP subunit